jgi:thiamine-monophosphate kinase
MLEFQIIKKILKPLTNNHQASQNLADDVAKFTIKNNEELVVSKDMFVENIHFFLSDGGFKIASKLLRTNLSDIAASGATPLYYMLGFSKNERMDEKFLQEFARGLKSVQDEFNLCLIGGDTVSSSEAFFSITIFGSIKKNQNLLRSNAKNGDLIFVSGSIGNAFLGLQAILQKIKISKNSQLLQHHFFPTPRLKLGKILAEKRLSLCAIDISDGLLADLNHMCQASNLNAEIYRNKIPISKTAKNFLQKNPYINPLDLLSGGDDYELIFTINPKNYQKIINLSKSLKLELTCIGNFTKNIDKNLDKKFEIFFYEDERKKQRINIKKLGYEH